MDELELPFPPDGVQVTAHRDGTSWQLVRSIHRPGGGWSAAERYTSLTWDEAEDLMLILLSTALG